MPAAYRELLAGRLSFIRMFAALPKIMGCLTDVFLVYSVTLEYNKTSFLHKFNQIREVPCFNCEYPLDSNTDCEYPLDKRCIFGGQDESTRSRNRRACCKTSGCEITGKCTLGIFLCLILREDFLSDVFKFLRRTRCVR